MFSHPPDPYSASALDCLLLADSTCRVVRFVISIVTYITWSVCWKWIAHHASWEKSTQKNRRWLDRFSSVNVFDSSILCLYFGLITCEKCTSSVTAKPRSVWCAQWKNVVWTHNDLLPSVAVAIRMATCTNRIQECETGSRDLTTEAWNRNAKILNWKIIAVTKNKRCRKTGAVCAVWVCSAPARIVRLQWIIRGTHTLLHNNRGDHFIATTHPTMNSSPQRRWWVLFFLRGIVPSCPLFLLPSSDDLNCQVILGVLVPALWRLRVAQCSALPNVSAHVNDLVDGILHDHGVLLTFDRVLLSNVRFVNIWFLSPSMFSQRSTQPSKNCLVIGSATPFLVHLRKWSRIILTCLVTRSWVVRVSERFGSLSQQSLKRSLLVYLSIRQATSAKLQSLHWT